MSEFYSKRYARVSLENIRLRARVDDSNAEIVDLKRRLADAPHRKNCAARCQYRLGLHPCGKIKCNHKPEARSACDCR